MSVLEKQRKVCVLGSGIWGTAIATQINRKLASCVIFTKTQATFEGINFHHINKGANLATTITAEIDFAKLNDYENIVIASPSYALYEVIDILKNNQLPKHINLIIATKGLDIKKNQLISQTLEFELENQILILSGPSFSDEVINNHFTAINLASTDTTLASSIAELLSADHFVAIPSTDVVGVQLSGCMKNVIAILVGILRGLNYGDNLCSIVIAKGIQEIKELAAKLDSNHHTSSSSDLAILGDTILSCSSIKSRNMSFGLQLATGVITSNKLVEGKLSIESLLTIASRNNVEMKVAQLAFDCVNNQANLRKIIDKSIPALFIVK
jgi:glycerol-3-phosphate dehydrogenase (NAD(P)+)